MPSVRNFTGMIKVVTYQSFLTESLEEIDFENFDINSANSFGIIKTLNNKIAYSKWVSPKRTRSYPFARIYNTYNASKVLTIIPIIKDEGSDGDRDIIQYSTISWMNLLNIYIVLAYYEKAEKSDKKGQENKHKIHKQKFNCDFVNSQIQEIIDFKQSALHWNNFLIESRFTSIFETALNYYDEISKQTNVKIHSRNRIDRYLQNIILEFESFKNISLQKSLEASRREAKTLHKYEFLSDGLKATFEIKNYLGGTYYLTPDEIVYKNGIYIVQESKNSSENLLPSLSDIQDGLFKLILFSNLDSLQIEGKLVTFEVSLKLSGKGIIGSLILPEEQNKVASFIDNNIFSKNQQETIHKLVIKSSRNNIKIEICGNKNT